MKKPILQNHDNCLFPIRQHHTMKIKVFALFAALFMSAGIASAATNDLAGLLQKGLFEEEANHNLAAAIRDYQAAIDGFDQDRQLAATAVFRLGECLRKEGKTNEANVQYARILRDFADQTNLAGLSRDYLGPKAPPAAAVGSRRGRRSAQDPGNDPQQPRPDQCAWVRRRYHRHPAASLGSERKHRRRRIAAGQWR
jgi:hypothetical protein